MKAIVLARSPGQHLRPDDFELSASDATRQLQEGEARVRVRWLSIDPYQRGLLHETPMFGRRVLVGDIMAGRGVGEVVESRCTHLAPGDLVLGETGWSTESIVDGAKLARIEGPDEFLPHHLGILGVPGMTALLGLDAMGGVGAHDVLLVSSAAGAVGSTVVQLAKMQGATVIGLTSGPAKTRLVKEELKADVVIDRLQGRSVADALLEAAPSGLSCFFDNVGEETLVAGLEALRPRGRALLCGYIAGYEAPVQQAPHEALRIVMRQRLQVSGFGVHDHADRFGEARKMLVDFLGAGRLQPVQSVVRGLHSAPGALCDLLAGRAAGKVIVQITD